MFSRRNAVTERRLRPRDASVVYASDSWDPLHGIVS
jgi:hypothetical protein